MLNQMNILAPPPLALDAAETAKDRVAVAARGKAPRFFNPFVRAALLTNVTEPSSLLIKLGDPFDVVDAEEVVVAWDNAQGIVGAFKVKEGTSVAVPIPEVLGRELEVWVSDSAVPVTVEVKPFSTHAENVDKAADSVKAEAETILDKTGDQAAKVGSAISAAFTRNIVFGAIAVGAGLLIWNALGRPGVGD